MRTFALIGLMAATMMTPAANAADVPTNHKSSIMTSEPAHQSRDNRRTRSEGRAYREGRRDGAQNARQNYRQSERRDERRDAYRERRSYRDGRQDQRQVYRQRRNDNHFEYRGQRYNNWNNSWRQDRRYNWRDYRNNNRAVYRIGRYHGPNYGRGYSRLSIGFTIGSPYYASNYWIHDPWAYRLPSVYGPYRWVRYYDDVLLIDVRNGRIIDVEYNFFW